jgi:diguanylate cyclase (GGDEF)-like protein
MKRGTQLVIASGAAWAGLTVWSLATHSRSGEYVALIAGAVLLLSTILMWRATDRERRHWQQALDAMQAGVVVYDADDHLRLTNADFRTLYGLSPADAAPGVSFESLLRSRVQHGLVPEALGREQAWIAERVAQHRSASNRSFLREMVDGRWRRITEQKLPDGGRLGFSIDVTELVDNQRALEAARQDADRERERAAAENALLDDALESLPDGFALYDADDRLVLCNQRYREIYRETAPALVVGASFESILRYGIERGQYPQAADAPEAWLADRLQRHRQPDGVPILQELQGNRWLRIDERRTRSGGVAGVRTDVTEMVRTRQQLEALNHTVEAGAQALREANALLEQLSSTDALTGCANRRRFDARLHEEVQRAHRHAGTLALLLLDIDHFKLYNDRLGHPQGDRALQAVAAVLQQQARRPGEIVARYGGEEFAVLLPHAGIDDAVRVAERCLRAIDTLALPHGASPTAAHMTLSIGVAALDTARRENAASLLQRTDAALYNAKAAGRARWQLALDMSVPEDS